MALDWYCIGATGTGRPCGRGADYWAEDAFPKGGQPVCWQHRGKLEYDLQRLFLGVLVPLPDTVVPIGDVEPSYSNSWDEGPCRAVIEDGRCREPQMIVMEMQGAIRVARVMRLPLCADHVRSLTQFFRDRWNQEIEIYNPDATWGWQVAERYRLASPT